MGPGGRAQAAHQRPPPRARRVGAEGGRYSLLHHLLVGGDLLGIQQLVAGRVLWGSEPSDTQTTWAGQCHCLAPRWGQARPAQDTHKGGQLPAQMQTARSPDPVSVL